MKMIEDTTMQRPAGMTAMVSSGRPQTTTWAGYAAFAWTLVFIVFHVYWYLGGHLGIGDAPNALPGMPSSVGGWIVQIVELAMFVAGLVVPVALVRRWERIGPRWMLLSLTWLGSAVLAVRGGAGIVDDLLRMTHILPNGLTGLTYEQALGQAHPSAYTLWSLASIDVYFLIGGILFGVAAWTLRDLSQVVHERDSRPTRPH
jgi:uncharacterized protein DUF3995